MQPLAWDDPLPARPRRILVTGTSGAGKTTVAAALSGRLGIPHTDIDGLYHGPGWVPRPEFVDDVAALAAREEWVTEWQYSVVRPLLLGRADLLVWLDLTRAAVMRQIVPRTLRRRLRRVELWNGNVEPPLWTLLHRSGPHPALGLAHPRQDRRPRAPGARLGPTHRRWCGCAPGVRCTPGSTAPSPPSPPPADRHLDR